MYWLAVIPLYALGLFLAGLVGYKWRELTDRWRTLKATVEALKTRQDKIAPIPKPNAVFLDGDDIVARARWEHEQLMRGLNPK